MVSAARSTLADLRVALRHASLAPRRTEGVVPTGIAAIDELLAGGLPRGRLTELSGRRSTGRTALALSALAAATARGEAAALVDVGGALDARRARAAGVELERLLWAQAPDVKRGAQAADLVLQAGGFSLVVLDLGEAMPRLPDASWLRLSRGAERSGAALLVLSPPPRASSATLPTAGTFAALHLELARAPRGPRFVAATRSDASPRVLVALEAQLTVVRARRGGEGGEARVELRARPAASPTPPSENASVSSRKPASDGPAWSRGRSSRTARVARLGGDRGGDPRDAG